LKSKKLIDIKDIENIDIVLNEEEIKLLNKVFYELEEFEQITDCLEKAISDNKINHTQLNQLYKILTKTVYFKISLNRNVRPKVGIVKTFFEIPEIISKKLFTYIYRTR
jgi:hypothetical protein